MGIGATLSTVRHEYRDGTDRLSDVSPDDYSCRPCLCSLDICVSFVKGRVGEIRRNFANFCPFGTKFRQIAPFTLRELSLVSLQRVCYTIACDSLPV